jgi:methionyl-tRNA synthetase
VHFRGEKMSKSLGTAVEPLDAAQKFGPDPLRLYLVKEIAFGSDGDFTWERFEERYNVDLANNLGNLVSRTLNLIEKLCGGIIPVSGAPGPTEERLTQELAAARANVEGAMDELRFHDALTAIIGHSGAVNRYIDGQAPWKAVKQPGGELAARNSLQFAAHHIRQIAKLLSPFVPGLAADILRRVDAEGGRVIKGEALVPRLELKAEG